MANHVLSREDSTTIVLPSVRRRRLLELGAALVVGAIVIMAAILVAGRGDDTTPAVQADGLRWEALVASEFPGATPAAVAEAARWQALADAYADYTILPEGTIASGTRWQAQADSYTRGRLAATARMTGLAAHYHSLPPALQAAADRYQGMAESTR